MPILADTVIAARVARRLTQGQFADAVGVSTSTIWEVEKGGTPSETTVDKIARFLGTTPTALVGDGFVFSRSAPRPKKPVRFSDTPRLPQQEPVPPEGEDMPEEQVLTGYFHLLNAEARAELIGHAHRLWSESYAQPRASKVGKAKG